MKLIRIHPDDNVAVALTDLKAGEQLNAAGDRLLEFVLAVASGKKTKSEERGAREIAIFKVGVTL